MKLLKMIRILQLPLDGCFLGDFGLGGFPKMMKEAGERCYDINVKEPGVLEGLFTKLPCWVHKYANRWRS